MWLLLQQVYIYSSNIFPPKHSIPALCGNHVLFGAWVTLTIMHWKLNH